MFQFVAAPTTGKVVDVPCGAGAFLQRLKDAGFEDVVGVDIENELSIDHEAFVQGDMTQRLPMDTGSVDTVVCIDGTEHIGRQQDFVREVARTLKPGGEFIVSTPNISAIRSRWKWLMTGHHHKCSAPLDELNPSPSHHIGMISFPELRYLLHTNGFRVEQVRTNRIKASAWLTAPLIPLVMATTWGVYRSRGRREHTARICREVRRTMFSRAILLGEAMIVRAIRASGGVLPSAAKTHIPFSPGARIQVPACPRACGNHAV